MDIERKRKRQQEEEEMEIGRKLGLTSLGKRNGRGFAKLGTIGYNGYAAIILTTAAEQYETLSTMYVSHLTTPPCILFALNNDL